MSNFISLKEGDKVRKLDGTSFSNGEYVLTVNYVQNHERLGLIAYFKETSNFIDISELVLDSKRPFTKSDLKDGMVVTYRDGEERLIFEGELYYKEDSRHRCTWSKSFSLKTNFKDDLTNTINYNKDIMKVTYMGEVLWEREELSPEQKRIKELEEGIAKASLIIKGQQGDTQELQEFLNKLL